MKTLPYVLLALVMLITLCACNKCDDSCTWSTDCVTRQGELVYYASGSGCRVRCEFPLFAKNVDVWCPED